MALSKEQVADRIVAARRVRGYHQLELQRLFYEEGEGDFGTYDLGKIERQEKDLTPHGRTVLAKLLGVPETWFTMDDPFSLLSNGTERDPLEARVDQIAGELRDLRERISQLAQTTLAAGEGRAARSRSGSSTKRSGAKAREPRSK